MTQTTPLEHEAIERYRSWACRQLTTPSSWACYLAGFKAGGIYLAHTSGRLSDPEFRSAIAVLAEVLDIEIGGG